MSGWGAARARPFEWREQRDSFATSRAGVWWGLAAVVVLGAYLASLLVSARVGTAIAVRWNEWVGVGAASLPMAPIAWRCRRSAQLAAAWAAFLLGVGLYNVATVMHLVGAGTSTPPHPRRISPPAAWRT